MLKLAVIGAGSWGTALAYRLAKNNYRIGLWVHNPNLAKIIDQTHENPSYLPKVSLPANIQASSSLDKVLSDSQYCILVVPCQFLRGVAESLVPCLAPKTSILTASKGIENTTLLRPTQILSDVIPKNLGCQTAVLSGPTFAKEVAAGLPSAAVVASEHLDTAKKFQKLLTAPGFRLYVNTDVIGTEIGGALKNVIAIAAGVSDGLGFGLNARAALITRGLAEITRLGLSLGANPLTFQGLSGLGDLVLTCTGDLSRNRRVGLKLGKGNYTLTEIQQGMQMVAEGVPTARAAKELAAKQKIPMPITEQVYSLLFEGKNPRSAVQELMGRELTSE
ncbi:MAG: NAD(P)-dependent glycerol-3-phosphate dehydrogenase [Candidatus Schekmanbacteria bacterium]|nr:NAD(P)-dependent glycerol-3-phosphate dehydrogenase [Candidatus Schekmanbacteria bacterium]